MSRWREIKAGAPIFRGRWAAIIWLWWSGIFIGEMDIGIFWEITGAVRGDPGYFVPQHQWWFDAVMAVLSVFCLVMGVLALDRYGRNAWLTWVPEDQDWCGIKRDEVKREPMTRPLVAKLRWH